MIPAVLILCTGLLLLVFFWPLGLVVTAVGGGLVALILIGRADRQSRAELELWREAGRPIKTSPPRPDEDPR